MKNADRGAFKNSFMQMKRPFLVRTVSILIIILVGLLLLEGMGQILFKIRHRYWLVGHDDAAYIKLFRKHPYLVVEPSPNTRFQSKGGLLFSHNALGTRGVETGIQKRDGVKRILAIGGSSTYCVGVSDNQTWPYYLQEKLGTGYEVINMGVPGYTTVEHIIQTALNISDISPDICIFYIGWNDIRNQHVAHLRSDYSDFHGKSQYNHLMLDALKIGNHSVIIRTVSNIVKNIFVRDPEGVYTVVGAAEKFTTKVDKRALDLYRRNAKLLITLCRAQGIRPVMVPQVLRYDMLTGDKEYEWIPYVKDKDIKAIMDVYNDALKDLCAKEKADFVGEVLAVNYDKSHFVDNYGHFTPSGNNVFADVLMQYIKKYQY